MSDDTGHGIAKKLDGDKAPTSETKAEEKSEAEVGVAVMMRTFGLAMEELKTEMVQEEDEDEDSAGKEKSLQPMTVPKAPVEAKRVSALRPMDISLYNFWTTMSSTPKYTLVGLVVLGELGFWGAAKWFELTILLTPLSALSLSLVIWFLAKHLDLTLSSADMNLPLRSNSATVREAKIFAKRRIKQLKAQASETAWKQVGTKLEKLEEDLPTLVEYSRKLEARIEGNRAQHAKLSSLALNARARTRLERLVNNSERLEKELNRVNTTVSSIMVFLVTAEDDIFSINHQGSGSLMETALRDIDDLVTASTSIIEGIEESEHGIERSA